MTMRMVNRNGEVPPGCVDGFCAVCKRETIVAADDPRCEDCGTPLHRASLPTAAVCRQAARTPNRQQTGPQEAQSEPKAADPTPRALAPVNAHSGPAESKPKRLSATREAVLWDRATDALLAATERRAEAAQAAYEQAEAEHKAAQRELNWLRQMRALVQVDGAAALPALPEPARGSKRGGQDKLPAGKWSRDYDACRVCNSAEGKHAAKGRCRRCDSHWREHGHEWPHKEAPNDGN